MLYEINKNQNHNFFLGEPSFKSEENKTIIEIQVKSTYDVKNDQGFRSHLMVSNFVVPNFNGQFDIGSFRGLRQVKIQTFSTK